MELANIIYRYVNRFINSNELIELLSNIDKNNFTKNELKQIEKLLEEVKQIIDSVPMEIDTMMDSKTRYEQLYNLLVNNSLYINYCNSMNDLELLGFITQYISAPLPPNINQETFDNLVRVGIKNDKREALWRLAFNYNGKNKDFSLIENYFIEKKDDFYLIEFIYAVYDGFDVDKIINTNDKIFMSNCYNRSKNMEIFTDEEMEKLKGLIINDI